MKYKRDPIDILMEKQTGTLTVKSADSLRDAGRTFRQTWGYPRAKGFWGLIGIPQPVIDFFSSLGEVVGGLYQLGISIFPELGKVSKKLSDFVRKILSFDTTPYFQKAFGNTTRVTASRGTNESVSLAGFLFEDDEKQELVTIKDIIGDTSSVVEPVKGCMDPDADNYNPDATISGECDYEEYEATDDEEEEEEEEYKEVVEEDDRAGDTTLAGAMIEDMNGLSNLLDDYKTDDADIVFRDFLEFTGSEFKENEFEDIFSQLKQDGFSLMSGDQVHTSILEKVIKPVLSATNNKFYEAMKRHYKFDSNDSRNIRHAYTDVAENLRPEQILADTVED